MRAVKYNRGTNHENYFTVAFSARLFYGVGIGKKGKE